MGSVDYNGKTVSDQAIKDVLSNIAEKLSVDVTITSGDRDSVVTGSSNKSHHIQHRAADFYVSTFTLAQAYDKIKDKKSEIFAASKRYQIIHHGTHTDTGGAHLHVGRYASGTGTKFCTEGLTSETSGTYSCTTSTASILRQMGGTRLAGETRSAVDDEASVG